MGNGGKRGQVWIQDFLISPRSLIHLKKIISGIFKAILFYCEFDIQKHLLCIYDLTLTYF